MLGGKTSPLYFAKTDVQSAFDTIPQAAIVGLLDSVPQRSEYQIAKHVEIKDNNPNPPHHQIQNNKAKKLLRKWHATALRNGDKSALVEIFKDGQPARNNTIFVESVVRKKYDTSAVLQLVVSHIQQNLVKVGKKYYRQRRGIPQGSILSATLCNYFYADLEIHVLGFLDSEDCLLLRLIDDFLLITTDKSKASRFVETMHRGVPKYGVTVNPAKTLVNFNLLVDDIPVPRIFSNGPFPYCGMLINPSTLNITRDRKRGLTAAATTSPSENINFPTFNSLTVEYSRVPGQTFQRKVLNAFRIQSHLMYLDTSLNSTQTMLLNLRSAFVETATKMWAYARCLPRGKKPSPALVIRTVASLSSVAFLLATSKARRKRYPGYACDVRKNEVAWLAYCAFVEVLEKKQAGYGEVLRWLRGEIRRLGASEDIRRGRAACLTRLKVAQA
jgi:telomerase reverse transcriptase